MAETHHPLEVIRKASKIIKSVIVGISGGKDSIATLDLCKKHFDRIEGYFMHLVPGLSFQENYLKVIERRYEISILRLPHWQLSGMMRNGSFRFPTGKSSSVKVIKTKDIDNYVRRHFGINWIATGELMCDSLERRGMLSTNGGIDHKRRRIFPLAHWTNASVFNYLKTHRIPLAPDYGMFARQSRGGSFGRLWADELLAIRKRHPEDFEKICKHFPLVKAQVKRHEFTEARKKEGK